MAISRLQCGSVGSPSVASITISVASDYLSYDSAAVFDNVTYFATSLTYNSFPVYLPDDFLPVTVQVGQCPAFMLFYNAPSGNWVIGTPLSDCAGSPVATLSGSSGITMPFDEPAPLIGSYAISCVAQDPSTNPNSLRRSRGRVGGR